jgi:hypothetical protein
MAVRAPAKTPVDPSDASVARVAARTSADRGFVFFSNYVRGLNMPDRPGFQVRVQLPSGAIALPETPVRLPSGAYGIWPVNLALGTAPGSTLRYSTAQLFKRVESHGQTWYFFFALPGIQPEFMLDPTAHPTGMSDTVVKAESAAGIRLRVKAGTSGEIRLEGGVHLVLLPEEVAETVWRVDDPSLLLSTVQAAFSDGSQWTIQSIGDPEFSFGIFGATEPPQSSGVEVRPGESSGVFRLYRASLPQVRLQVKATQLQPAGPPPPITLGPAVSWRPQPIAMAPDDAAFKAAAVWKLDLSTIPPNAHVHDAFLSIVYQGDEARLSRGKQLLDDNFWNGLPWQVGLRELSGDWRAPRELELRILPLPRNFPMYLERASDLHFDSSGVAGSLGSVELIPCYQLELRAPGSP